MLCLLCFVLSGIENKKPAGEPAGAKGFRFD